MRPLYPSLGALWFLVVLFWTKSLYSLMNVILQHQNKGIVFLFLTLIGRLVSKYIWLPQSMDVVLIAVLFIYIGQVMKEYSNILQKNQMILTIGCFSLWMISWEYGIYIEMGTRSYPLFIICIVEAICGCFCVISLSQVIEACTWLAKILMTIGQHTLFLLCVHHIEWNFSIYWSNKTTVELCIIRMIYALGLLIVLLAYNKIKKRINNT